LLGWGINRGRARVQISRVRVRGFPGTDGRREDKPAGEPPSDGHECKRLAVNVRMNARR